MRFATKICFLVCILLSKTTFSQITDSIVLSQSLTNIRYKDRKGGLSLEIKRLQKRPGIVECSMINISDRVIGYYRYFNDEKIHVPKYNYWTPTFSNFDPVADAGWGIMVLLYPNQRKTFLVDIRKFRSYDFSFFYCNNVQTFLDSAVAKDIDDWKYVNVESEKQAEISVPYGGRRALFTTIYFKDISKDTAKQKTITCIVGN